MTDTEWTKEFIEHRDRAAMRSVVSDITGETIPMYHAKDFKEGWDQGATYERERAKVLVEALREIKSKENIFSMGCDCAEISEQALAKYGGRGE